MREILFKAKRKDTGEWVEGSLLRYKDGSSFICCEDYIPDVMNKYDVIDSSVCQCTGLTDKNGRKVFDGDLVKCLYEDIVNGDYISEIHTCDMENYYCMLRIISAYEIEVIGNIHDGDVSEVEDG